jgi:putative spermidine/putrescine transport system permease protein
VRLIYNGLGVTVGLVSAALPFAVFPIYSVLGRIPPSLTEAARTLGADRGLIFWRITFPLTLPAVASGIVIVFLYSLGAFATPVLLGGGFVDLIAVFSYEQAVNLANYGFAAAGAVVTLGCAFVLVYVFNRVVEALVRV